MSYFVLFPISFRFLGTYSVADKVHSTITLDSYISTFTSLTLIMGVVFQLPVVAFFLGKLGIISSSMLTPIPQACFYPYHVCGSHHHTARHHDPGARHGAALSAL